MIDEQSVTGNALASADLERHVPRAFGRSAAVKRTAMSPKATAGMCSHEAQVQMPSN
jgi:hypothetical protein